MNDPTASESTDGTSLIEPERPSTARRWEQYTVRYFVGAVVGAVIIFALRDSASLSCEFAKLIPGFGSVDARQMTAVAAMGWAFCYVASVPVLTLHTVRGGLEINEKSVKRALVLVAVVGAAIVSVEHL